MMNLALRRRFYAEELEAVCRFRSPRLVEAFASVPREQFLPPGPWTVLADSDFMATGMTMRRTDDADPARVYHNIAVAVDPARQLFNGQPGTLGVWIDALALTPGARVLHVGCGTGYYAAVMAHCVGPTGRLVAIDVDPALAGDARRNLAPLPWADVRHGDAAREIDGPFDAILVNAGVTHPLDAWLDAIAPGGRMIVPLTSALPAMGATIGKGLAVLLTFKPEQTWSARVLSLVAIYSAERLRDPAMDAPIGKALMGGPMQWRAVNRLRRDAHEPSPTCWLHGPTFCLCAEKCV